MALDWIDAELEALSAAGLLRAIEPVRGACGPELVFADGERLLSFSSNDYLGLAGDPRIGAALASATARWGAGSGAARLVTGAPAEHDALEQELAAFVGAEAALLFGAGFLANVGALPALAGEGDLVVSDELNHASLIDGLRLSRAKVVVAPHRQLEAFDRALRAPARRRFVVTDSVFSMDGDVAPLAELRALADRHGAALYVDEAHAFGVLGPTGAGALEASGVTAEVRMGTLGKSLGGAGAFVAGEARLRSFLLHRARSFVFSTAPPAALSSAARAALAIVREEPHRRAQALALAARFRAGCAELGLDTRASTTHIVPVVIGAAEAAVAVSRALRARGVLVRPIRPPTVPPGTSRLRFSFTAAHTEAQVDAALAALAAVVPATARGSR